MTTRPRPFGLFTYSCFKFPPLRRGTSGLAKSLKSVGPDFHYRVPGRKRLLTRGASYPTQTTVNPYFYTYVLKSCVYLS